MEIQKFNNTICEIYDDEFPLIDYIKLLNTKTQNIDLSFIEDFFELVDKDTCCINHELLLKYGITQFTGGSMDVKKIIERNDGVDGLDYTVCQLADRDDCSHKINYFLHPTFKIFF